MKKIFLFCAALTVSSLIFSQEKGQWSVEKANEWYKKQAWILGCNYVPSTAVNDVEFWQTETFDPATIDRELGWAKNWGINSVRVFLNYVVWEADSEGLIKRFEQFLSIAAKHGISVMPVLFDDCNFSGGIATVGKQPELAPYVSLKGWVSSPPFVLRDNPASFPKLKAYVQGIVKPFVKDKRIIAWDLYNEPYNADDFGKKETHPSWLCYAYRRGEHRFTRFRRKMAYRYPDSQFIRSFLQLNFPQYCTIIIAPAAVRCYYQLVDICETVPSDLVPPKVRIPFTVITTPPCLR